MSVVKRSNITVVLKGKKSEKENKEVENRNTKQLKNSLSTK